MTTKEDAVRNLVKAGFSPLALRGTRYRKSVALGGIRRMEPFGPWTRHSWSVRGIGGTGHLPRRRFESAAGGLKL